MTVNSFNTVTYNIIILAVFVTLKITLERFFWTQTLFGRLPSRFEHLFIKTIRKKLQPKWKISGLKKR